MPSKFIRTRPNDPNIYLWSNNDWYAYNPSPNFILGQGAMGTVYRGERCSDRMPVAIKRVHDAFCANRMIRDRARLEAQLAFRHDNMVEMLGCCEYDPLTCRGPIFLISKLVNGQNIDEYAASLSSDVKVEKISRAICSVLDALSLVHAHEVLHRDIKPSNIMIENGTNARLMDLGIARMTGRNSLTSTGFVGTPEYSAPEQIKSDETGKAEELCYATDIYEMGITYYELLTGTNPMAADNQVDTLQNQLTKPLPPHKDIPSKLMNVILKATEKKPSERYQTAKEFKEAIENALIVQPPKIDRFYDWLNKNFGIIITIFIILFVLIVFILILIRK